MYGEGFEITTEDFVTGEVRYLNCSGTASTCLMQARPHLRLPPHTESLHRTNQFSSMSSIGSK